jgi:thymidine phosphorylase
LNPLPVIEAVRDGASLPPGALEEFLQGYLAGSVEEYQMAAFLMAVVLNGISRDDLTRLVQVMLHSGAVLDLSHLPGPRIDKHSTGGVGDKVSLVLAPLAAECGLFVPMMSGRGLGHTGGTLDKLESIPGFRTDLSLEAFQEVLEAEGVAMIGQTREIAPLDRRLYDLRSVTGTVPSIPLIAASIMSKKLAEGLTGMVLDVKAGSGAFLTEEAETLALARTMVEIGEDHGVPTTALVTAMDRPLGRSAGNVVEVREALACLRGEGPADLREVVLQLATEMQLVANPGTEFHRTDPGGVTTQRQNGAQPVARDRAMDRARDRLDGGFALERFRRLVERQGGDPHAVDDPDLLPSAPVSMEVPSPATGTVVELRPRPLGQAVVELGGGRVRLGQNIDPTVGYADLIQPGQEVEAGALLGTVHAASAEAARKAASVLASAIRIGAGPTPARSLISHRISAQGVLEFGPVPPPSR